MLEPWDLLITPLTLGPWQLPSGSARYGTAEEAQSAKSALNGADLCGSSIVVDSWEKGGGTWANSGSRLWGIRGVGRKGGFVGGSQKRGKGHFVLIIRDRRKVRIGGRGGVSQEERHDWLAVLL